MATNLDLLDTGERRRWFLAMLQDAEREADRDGAFSVESVLADVDRIINSGS